MLNWALNSNCDLIVSAAGVPYGEKEPQADTPTVFAVGSTQNALKKATDAGIAATLNGSVSGIPAVLLNEGAWRNYDVITLLVKVAPDAPDFRAGAAIAEALAKIAPGASCDVQALLKEAEGMEKILKRIRNDQGPAQKSEQMYG
jgi:predicted ATP-grasp superfamily ATP-dependent carboligase